MPYYIAIYDWSLYTLPSALSMNVITSYTHANHPDTLAYNPNAPTWIGHPFTFNGGSSTRIAITDDDGQFEDAYVETGGAQTLTENVTINGTTYLAGSVIENEFSMLDAFGNEVFVVRISGVNVGFAYPVGLDPRIGSTFTATEGRDGAAADSSDGISSSSEPYANIVCYAPGTMIATPDGPRAVETLAPGDLVLTRDHRPQPIRWTYSGAHPLEDFDDEAKPVQITAGALGAGLPAQDLVVSPQHRILVGGAGQLDWIFPREAFVPAKSLTAVPGIHHMKGMQKIIWVHFACDRHEVVIANGCLSESLLLGPMMVNGLNEPDRRAVIAIYGPAPSPGAALNGPPARDCLTVGAARRRIARHIGEKDALIASEIQKWGRDLLLEQDEAGRVRKARKSAPPSEKARRVA